MTDAPLDTLDIAQRIAALPRDEQEVLLMVLQGAEQGLAQYGALDLDADERDLEMEALAEHRDACFYLAADIIRRKRRRG